MLFAMGATHIAQLILSSLTPLCAVRRKVLVTSPSFVTAAALAVRLMASYRLALFVVEIPLDRAAMLESVAARAPPAARLHPSLRELSAEPPAVSATWPTSVMV